MISSFFCATKQLEARIINKKGNVKKVDEQPRLALREEGGLQDGAATSLPGLAVLMKLPFSLVKQSSTRPQVRKRHLHSH
jgi:hypothetical protein